MTECSKCGNEFIMLDSRQKRCIQCIDPTRLEFKRLQMVKNKKEKDKDSAKLQRFARKITKVPETVRHYT